MYSVMLAAMMTTGTATPDWGCRGCHGCWGCSGCYSCAACWGCGGCWGYGGCNAFSCGCGGCWGCAGCWACSGCWGCAGCSFCHGCSGCWCSGCWCSGVAVCWGCSGCWGSGCSWYCHGCSSAVVVYPAHHHYGRRPEAAPAPGKPAPGKPAPGPRNLDERLEGKPKATTSDDTAAEAPAPARVTVRVPEQARLFVDDVACPLTSATRTFETPELRPGQEYYYIIRAEVVRQGRVDSDTRRVTVRAGKESVVDFGDLKPVQAAQR